MLNQSGFSVKRGTTKFTSRLLDVSILYVNFKIILGREHFIADIALHRAVSTVCPQMLVPIVFLTEGFSAQFTSKRFRACMGSQMYRQLRQISEVFLANFTLPLPSMFRNVFAELLNGAHLFSTIITNEGTDVNFIMVTWIFEFICATVTFITVEVSCHLPKSWFLIDSLYFYHFNAFRFRN